MILLAVHVHGEREILARFEEIDFFFEQQGVGAEVNIFFAFDEPFDDLFDLRVKKRFAAGDGNHRGAAFIDGVEALLRREIFFEDVGGILNFSAAGAGEIAAEERFKHEHERIMFPPFDLLLEDVAGYGPHLGDGYAHEVPFSTDNDTNFPPRDSAFVS
jgi:hypothetical protein